MSALGRLVGTEELACTGLSMLPGTPSLLVFPLLGISTYLCYVSGKRGGGVGENGCRCRWGEGGKRREKECGRGNRKIIENETTQRHEIRNKGEETGKKKEERTGHAKKKRNRSETGDPHLPKSEYFSFHKPGYFLTLMISRSPEQLFAPLVFFVNTRSVCVCVGLSAVPVAPVVSVLASLLYEYSSVAAVFRSSPSIQPRNRAANLTTLYLYDTPNMVPLRGCNNWRWLVVTVVFLVATLACRCSAVRPGREGVELSTSGSVVQQDGTTLEEYEVGGQTDRRTRGSDKYVCRYSTRYP